MSTLLTDPEIASWLALILPALAGGIALVMLAAPLGCLVLWRNLSFFSDTLAHGALLGLALASLLSLPLWLGMLITTLILVLMLWSLNDARLPNDALLAGLASTMLALGLIVMSIAPALRASMMAFLFGDLLAITWEKAAIYAVLSVAGYLCIWRIWSEQIQCISNEALATVAGISVKTQRLYFMLLLAAFTAMAIQAVGTLLVSSLLILPALAARLWSQSPQQMVLYASIYGIIGLILGMGLSLWLGVASGLCIVVILAVMFLCTYVYHAVQHNTNKHLSKTC